MKFSNFLFVSIVASMVLTTESLVADIKEDTPAAPAMPAGGMY